MRTATEIQLKLIEIEQKIDQLKERDLTIRERQQHIMFYEEQIKLLQWIMNV